MSAGRALGALVPLVLLAVLVAALVWYARNRDKE
jgi:hypothetical protein